MRKMYLPISKIALIVFFLIPQSISAQQVFTTYLWHMDQPVYWADRSLDKPESKQYVEESQRLKMNGGNVYTGSPVAHPTNDLQDIFSKADRVNAYQFAPRDAVNSIKDLPNSGAQLSISGGLMENIQSLGLKNQWGYSPSWMNAYKEANSWKTSGGFPRLDIVCFSNDHVLSPLISDRTLVKQIKVHQYVANKYYGYTSKGYWPAECAFSERIIKSLVDCGIQWSVIANSHLARTLSDYVHPYNITGNIEAPNKADIVAAKGNNWFSGTIDGRGSLLAAPYCYQAHKAQYVDPVTGTVYKIDVVPMCNYISYLDGYGTHGTSEIATNIEPFSSTTQPSIVLMAHDGDNAWGGGSSYYNESVTGFTHAAASAGYEPTTIQQFLSDHPVPANDIVHVEDGAWVNADSDWGHPQFINWLWPLYDATTYSFNPDAWNEDARNWAVITATENYVTMAEDLEGGNLRIQYIAEGGTSATNAEKAWHFYFGGLNSGFMYYGKAEDMEVKQSLTGNIAIDYANNVINAHSGVDNTAPSVFIPQRYPYNPGSVGFGPTTGYKKVNYSSDFTVWTFAYDVSGLGSVTLKYRTDNDGVNSPGNIQNETYAGGADVSAWQEIAMIRRPMAADPTNDPQLNFFILPKAKADLCYAAITGLKDTLVDYYVEAVDLKGNIFRTPIQHVYVSDGSGTNSGTTGNVTWLPTSPTTANTIIITCKNATSSTKLHWGVNNWTTAFSGYQPAGTSASSAGAVETPFVKVDSVWQIVLVPFNNPAQPVSSINFVINYGNNIWDNNGGSNYLINVSQSISNNPVGQNFTKTIEQNSVYTFSETDFGFSSLLNNTFKAIKIISLPTAGSLADNGNAVTVDQLVSNVNQLMYTASTDNASFSFKLVDSQNMESDAIYTATFNVTNPNTSFITVTFKKPAEWGVDPVYIWAWTDNGNLFATWPGVVMTDNGNGWYTYNFDASVTKVNMIFSKNGNPQTTDISGVTQSTCYEQSGLSGSRLTVETVSCITSAVENHTAQHEISVYPQPVTDKFVIELPNTGNQQQHKLVLYDLSGKIVLIRNFVGSSGIFERNKLTAGLYFLQVSSKNNKEVYRSKIALK